MIVKKPFLLFSCLILLFASCNDAEETNQMKDILDQVASITGKEAYLQSPFVTAGDRLYMVGHQDGSFPEIGWHVQGEMGGIWNHPIKLMDGLELSLVEDGKVIKLEKAERFINYPFANEHRYSLPGSQLQLTRRQYVPDGYEGIIVEYHLQNDAETARNLELNFTGYSD